MVGRLFPVMPRPPVVVALVKTIGADHWWQLVMPWSPDCLLCLPSWSLALPSSLSFALMGNLSFKLSLWLFLPSGVCKLDFLASLYHHPPSWRLAVIWITYFSTQYKPQMPFQCVSCGLMVFACCFHPIPRNMEYIPFGAYGGVIPACFLSLSMVQAPRHS